MHPASRRILPGRQTLRYTVNDDTLGDESVMTDFPFAQTAVYSFTFWFGLYLLARHPQKAGMRYAGLGLAAYAIGLELDTLAGFMDDNAALLRLRPLIGF